MNVDVIFGSVIAGLLSLAFYRIGYSAGWRAASIDEFRRRPEGGWPPIRRPLPPMPKPPDPPLH